MDYNKGKKDLVEDVRDHLKKDEIDEALKLFSGLDLDYIVLVENSFSTLRNEILKNILSKEEADRFKRRILDNFLEWIRLNEAAIEEAIKKRDKKPPSVNGEEGDGDDREPDSLTPFEEFLGNEIVSLIEALNQRGVKPRVHGIDLLAFEDNLSALIQYLRRYSVLKSLDDLRRVLYWKYNLQNGGKPLCGIASEQAESLYQSIFDQGALLSFYQRYYEETGEKLKVVIFRRGRHLRDLTNLLKTHPFVSLKIIISATDDGESWYKPSRAFLAPGLPGAAKALLDLCPDRLIRDFLGHRITEGQSNDFNSLLDRLEKPGPTKDRLGPEAEKLWIQGMRIPRRERLELVKYLRKAYQGFKHFYKKNLGEKKISFDGLPLRSLVLLGAGLFQIENLKSAGRAALKKIDWQRAVEDLYELLKIKKNHADHQHSEVLFPGQRPKHIVALREDGTLYFSESPINYHHIPSRFLGIWLMEETIDEKYVEAFIQECESEFGCEIKPRELEEKEWVFDLPKSEKIEEETEDQVRHMTYQVSQGAVFEIARKLGERSVSDQEEGKGSSSDVSPLARRRIEEADIILYGTKMLETNVGGALVTHGMGSALESSKKALKICLPDLRGLSGEDMETQLLDQLDRMSRYLSGRLLYKEGEKGAEPVVGKEQVEGYFDYVLAEFPEWRLYWLEELSEAVEEPKERKEVGPLLWKNGGKISFAGIDSSQNSELGFYASSLLVEVIFSLYEIKHAGVRAEARRKEEGLQFKVANHGRLLQGAVIDRGKGWERSPLGLFRSRAGEVPSEVRELIEDLKDSNKWKDIKKEGAFIFDVDMTILPSGSSAQLDRYQYLAYLFMRLLREGIRVAIISGNSEQVQMERIYRAIRSEMKDDPSAFKNLTFYVNGGGTKIRFNENGRKYYDQKYNNDQHFLISDYQKKITEVLVDAARNQFGLTSSQAIAAYQARMHTLFPNHHFRHTSLERAAEWAPPWYTEDEIGSIQRAKDPLVYPWVEMRGWSCNSEGQAEKAASLTIKPLPDFVYAEADASEEAKMHHLRAFIIQELKPFIKDRFIGPAGRSSIDIAVGKTKAIRDFMKQEGPLDAAHIYYFGDEFYTLNIEGGYRLHGNDQEILEQADETEGRLRINTIAVNHRIPDGKEMEGPGHETVWVGRTPQALLEFLEVILLEVGVEG